MKVRRWEPIVIVGISFGMMFLSILPTILLTIRLPKDRQYIPIHNSLSDYPYYTSIIAQGVDGQVNVVDRFTNEPQTGAYIHVLYLAIGWVGRLLRYTDVHGLYFGARILLGFAWMVVVYRFIKTFLSSPRARIAAYFFAVSGVGFPVFAEWQGTRFMTWPMGWWTEFNPILRAAFLPHYLLGHILFVLGLLSFMQFVKKGTVVQFGIGSVCAVFASIIHPPSYLILGLLVPVYGLLSRRFIRTLLAVIGISFGILPILYYRNIYAIFPWTLASSYERLSFSVPVMSYLLGLGPVLLLGVVGFILRLRKIETWVFIIWVIAPSICVELVWYLLGTSIGPRVTISNIRFLQMAVWLPLAVGAGFTIEKIFTRTPRVVGVLVSMLLCVITFLGYPVSLRAETSHVYGAYDFQFPKIGFVDAMKYIHTITGKNDVVLALPLAGQMIPSYSNRFVYVGNMGFTTKDLSRKMDEAWAFYVGIPDCDAYTFVNKNRITTVFYGFDEKKAGDAVLTYPFLKNAGIFGETELFGVNKSFAGCR